MDKLNNEPVKTSTEAAIRQSEERLRLFIAASSNTIYRMNADWTRMDNLVGKEMLADTPQPITGWIDKYILPQDQPQIQSTIQEAIASKSIFELEHRVMQADGSVGWVQSRATPLLNEQGEITEWFGIGTDITQRKQAERRQAFLLRLSDALRPLASSAEMERTAMRVLGEELGVDRAFFATIDADDESWSIRHDYADNLPSQTGRYPMSEFQRGRLLQWKAGRMSSIADSETDPLLNASDRAAYAAFGTRAAIGVPLVKAGRFAALLSVNQTKPRVWTKAELALTQETAERTWTAIERARAEEALQHLTEQLESQVKERTATLNKTTEELQKNLAILQQAENLAGIGSWVYNYTNQAFTWSNGMYQLFSMPQGTAVRPQIYVQAAVKEDHELAKQLANNIQTAVLPLPDIICIKADDTIKVLKIEATVVKDEKGKPVQMVGVDMDITSSKQAEKTLGEQAHFIQRTNEALPDILYVLNLHTKEILYINHPFENRLGHLGRQGDKIGRNLLEIVYEEDVPGLLAHYEELKKAADGQVCEFEYRIKAANGSLHWFRDRNAVFKRNKAGVPIEKIGIAQDITERKKAEQELKESNINLRYANENLRQFATIASHDLQEPLRKLQMFTAVLQRFKWELPEEGKIILSKIHLTSERMSQLIREVLQYSKIAYGVKEFVATDLDGILKNVLGDLELLLEETGAIIAYNNTLPRIDAIALQMNQLFYNLMTNALKFRKPGIKPVIQISVLPVSASDVRNNANLHEDRQYIEISFSDNGIGFDAHFAEQIFEIFERLHSTDKYEGTGVGLALCKKIVENHNGHIFATSNEGEGALFTIILPVSQ